MTLSSLDAYMAGNSWMHRWSPRLKLVSLMALMFAFSAVHQRLLLPPMLAVTALLYALSGLPLRFLLNRLSYPGLFILAVVILLPLTSGETVLWQWGWLAVRQEGLAAMVLVVCRFLSILTLGFILLGTTPFLTLIKAMRSLGLPSILADMTLLSYRYLYEMADTLATMQQAMRLRGFGYGRKHWLRIDTKTLQQLASLTGTLLIRSYEQSERVYQAMRLRGYGRGQALPPPTVAHPWETGSWVLSGCVLAIGLGFVVAERMVSVL